MLPIHFIVSIYVIRLKFIARRETQYKRNILASHSATSGRAFDAIILLWDGEDFFGQASPVNYIIKCCFELKHHFRNVKY